jgi:predicted transcriptional regulator
MAEAGDKVLIAQILSSYLSNNSVSPADLPSVIETVKRSFGGGVTPVPVASGDGQDKKWEPAVSVRKSVTPDAVICLCCGEKYKALKRHLATEHDLTPAEYRAAFNLKSDHPLVAPNYAAKRSELAKSLGLGRKAGTKAPARKKTGTRRTAAKSAAE